MVNKIKVHLDKKYITKALDKDTLLKVIASEHPSVLHRLYMISNEVKERQYFLELDHPILACTAIIKTHFAYTGPAKEQASVVSFMKDRIKQKPSFLIGLKIGTPLAAKAIAPRKKCALADIGFGDGDGFSGICHAFDPKYC